MQVMVIDHLTFQILVRQLFSTLLQHPITIFLAFGCFKLMAKLLKIMVVACQQVCGLHKLPLNIFSIYTDFGLLSIER